MKNFLILLFVSLLCLNFTGCKKILRSVAKDGTEDGAKSGAKDFAKEVLDKGIVITLSEDIALDPAKIKDLA